MADIYANEAWPIWIPGAWLAGFIKGTTRHCYTQNIKALREEDLCFPHYKSMGTNDPQGGDIFDPRVMIGRILIIIMYGTIKHCYMTPIPHPWGMVNLDPRGMVGRIYEGDYQTLLQNIEALGLVVSEKKIFFCFSHRTSVGAICCHGNHNFDTICSKT